jgi:hypothetical protein
MASRDWKWLRMSEYLWDRWYVSSTITSRPIPGIEGYPKIIHTLQVGGKEKSPLRRWLLLCLRCSRSLRHSQCTHSNVLMCSASLKWTYQFQVPPSVKCVLLFDFSMRTEKLKLKFIVLLLACMRML